MSWESMGSHRRSPLCREFVTCRLWKSPIPCFTSPKGDISGKEHQGLGNLCVVITKNTSFCLRSCPLSFCARDSGFPTGNHQTFKSQPTQWLPLPLDIPQPQQALRSKGGEFFSPAHLIGFEAQIGWLVPSTSFVEVTPDSS